VLDLALAVVLVSGLGTIVLEVVRTGRSGASAWRVFLESKQREPEWPLFSIGLGFIAVGVAAGTTPWAFAGALPLYALLVVYLVARPVGPIRRRELPDFDGAELPPPGSNVRRVDPT